MYILLVEDDEILGDGLKHGLKQEGYVVDWLQDGIEAENALKDIDYDLCILDLGLPRKEGLSVLHSIRDRGVKTKVIILTAKDSKEDKLSGLNVGADDYMTKPFDLDELLARIRALHRRTTNVAKDAIEIQGISIDTNTHIVKHEGKEITLPKKEFQLLAKLAENMGKVLTKEKLTSHLYGLDEDIDSNVLEVHIHNIRKKLPNNIIRTIRGIGYIIDNPKDI